MYYNEKISIRSNGFFERTFNWDVRKISNSDHANGYIVQKITRETIASDIFWKTHKKAPFCHKYFEAWKVDHGKIVYNKTIQAVQEDANYTFDDRWIYCEKIPSFEGVLNDCKDKYLTFGSIKITGDVYWLNSNDSRITIINKTFKENFVEYAGFLPAAYAFAELENEQSIFSYPFTVRWDFSTNDKFIEGICEIFKNSLLNSEQKEKDLTSIFSPLPIYEELRKHVLS